MLEIHEDVPLHRWKVVTLRDGSQTICFNHGGGCIYDVPVWELKTADGLDWWLKHLRRKVWFAETEEQFWEALREAKKSFACMAIRWTLTQVDSRVRARFGNDAIDQSNHLISHRQKSCICFFISP